MKALVIGASGRVGRHLLQMLHARGDTAVGTYHSRPFEGGVLLAIESGDAVERLISEQRPHVVFQPGSQTHVDACEDRPEEANRINMGGAGHIVQACEAVGAFLVHFSTDYVFDGAAGPYAEDAEPNPISHYGFTKREAEKVVAQSTLKAAIVRTAMIYEHRAGDGNFLMFLHDRLTSGEGVFCYTDQFGTPSYAPDIAAATLEIADRRLTGVIHVAGPDFLSRVEFARRVAGAFGLNADLIQPVTTSDRPQKARRPPKAGLRADRLKAELKTRMHSLDEALAKMTSSPR